MPAFQRTDASVPILPIPLTPDGTLAAPSSSHAGPSSSVRSNATDGGSASSSSKIGESSGSASGSGSKLKAMHHLSSGGLSGFVSAVSLQPLDLLKTRVQQAYVADSEVELVKGAKRRRIAITPVMKQVLRDDGIQGLWRGTVPTVVRNVPGAALYFYSLSTIRTYLTGVPYFAIPPSLPVSAVTADSLAALSPSTVPLPPLDDVRPGSTAISMSAASSPRSVYSSLSASPSDSPLPPTYPLSSSAPYPLSTSQSTLSSPSAPATATASSSASASSALPRLSPQGNLLAGAIGRSSVGFIMNPITVLKARYESSAYAEYRHRSMYSALRNIVRQHGIRGLFQGFTATAARDAPYAGLYLVFYEKGKEIAGRIKPEWGIPYALQHSSSGAFAAILATLLTCPADVVKTRMQVNSSTHTTVRSAVRRIYADRGLGGFFAGSSLRISRKAASSAISWTVYEALLLFLRDRQGVEGGVGAV